MKDGIIIQARTGSTRLHNKILLPFYGEQRIIDILIANIKQACPDKCIVLATTNRPQDDVLAETARQAGILSFRGDEDNVLDRFIRAAEVFGINRFIRVCSDNPFLRPETFNTFFAEHNFCPADYIAYGFADGRPTIKSHLGLYSELTTIDALRRAAVSTQEKLYIEHVTIYLYTHPENSRCVCFRCRLSWKGVSIFVSLSIRWKTSPCYRNFMPPSMRRPTVVCMPCCNWCNRIPTIVPECWRILQEMKNSPCIPSTVVQPSVIRNL